MFIQKEVTDKLKEEVKNNQVANAVFHLLATRKRTRSSLTLLALTQRMQGEGFKYSKKQYGEVLNTMAKLGVGTAITNYKGHCTGLKGIQVNLSELGRSVFDDSGVVKSSNVLKSIEKTLKTKVIPITAIDIAVEGKTAHVRFEEGVTPRELMSFLSRF